MSNDDTIKPGGKPVEELARIETHTRTAVETQIQRLTEKRTAYSKGNKSETNEIGYWHRYPKGAVVNVQVVVSNIDYAQGTLLLLNSKKTPMEILPGLQVESITPVTDEEGDH